jgi:VWFA-related protein
MLRPVRWYRSVLAFIAGSLLVPITAGVPFSQTQQFTARADVVLVDVSVLDQKRQPVRDLTAADFTILEDGKPQTVEYFKHIELPEAPAASTGWMQVIAPDVARNEDVSERRLVVIVLDDALIPFDPQMTTTARQIARDVVDRLGPGDLASVVFTRDNRPAQNFTRDRQRLYAAIDALESAGYEPAPGGETSPYNQQLFLSTLSTLTRAVDYLAAVPERRKALIYVSIGVPLNFREFAKPASIMGDLNLMARELTRRAQRGSVNIYAVDPGGLDGVRSYMMRRNQRTEPFLLEAIEQAPALYLDFLRAAAETTGGRAYLNTNEFKSRIDQLFLETGTFYLLGYTPQDRTNDGRFRRLQVRVNRRGVTVNTRTGYYAPPPPDVSARIAHPPKTDTALAGLVPKTALPLELVATPFGVSNQANAAVVVTVGMHSPPASRESLASGDTVELLLRAYTPQGDERGAARLTANVAPAAASGDEAGRYEVHARLNLPPGRYELRASASSHAWGASGSVYGYVDVPDFSRQPLSLSGITMAVTPPAIAGNTAVLEGLLPVVPTTRRAFAVTDRPSAFVRIYQSRNATSESIQVTMRILDAADRAVVDAKQTLDSGPLGQSGHADLQYPIPVERLSSGPHVLMIEAARGRQVARSAVRFDIR